MDILLTGANGQVGWELARQSVRAGIRVLALDRRQLDITHLDAVDRTIKEHPYGVVINAAAYTQVDRAETDPDRAFQVNRNAPAHLAQSCRAARIPLIHVSTDYVFSGESEHPYAESDPPSPTGVYGSSKSAGEDAIRDATDAHIILRTSWVYGVHGHNFVKTMLRLGAERKEIRVVSDQYGNPTSAADIAAVLLSLAGRILKRKPPTWGTYHYCGAGTTTWYDFATTIFKTAQLLGYSHDPVLKAISTADYPTAARRPSFSALDCSKIYQLAGILPPPWQDSLSVMLKEFLSTP